MHLPQDTEKMQDTVRNVFLGKDGLFESSKGSLAGKQRVDLLKAIEGKCKSLPPFIFSCEI